uniref:Zinc finger SWIM-type containing 1 n=1 Tax=Pavo cristatus TaxID=9049 RepID=A0A8C9ELK2_PAVCR
MTSTARPALIGRGGGAGAGRGARGGAVMAEGAGRGCLVSYELDAEGRMASVSFQSAAMGALFARFPQALLVHRACAPNGRVLYIFLADGPCLAARGAAGRVVHLAVPRNESAHGLARMCEAFRAFNPAWWRTRVLLVGPDLPEPVALGQAFPAAELRLSAFHVCKHLQEQIHRLGLEHRAEQLLLSTLHSAMCRATESKRREMHRVLSETVPPDLLPRFHAHWLLTDKIWATHGERSCKKSCDYFMELETVTQGLSQVFSAELFLETCIASLAKYYQKCVSESPLDDATEYPEGNSDEEMNQRAEERIVQSLTDICTESAARLCLGELAVVQKSVQLIGTSADAVNVQILEDAHKVTQEGLGHCTCHFNQAFQLPCRHIQAVLNSEGKTLQPEMLGRRWQKGCDIIQGVRDSADHLLEDLESPWDESRDKFLAVSSLTAEVSRLLACCSTEEFELRCSTLRALADSWIGPYMQVKL